MSNRAIMTVAVVPAAIYVIAMVAVLVNVPAPLLAGGGAFVALLSVGLANVLRLRRDRGHHA